MSDYRKPVYITKRDRVATLISNSSAYAAIKPLVAVARAFSPIRYTGQSISQRRAIAKKRFFQAKLGLPTDIAFEPVSTCVLDCEFCMLRELQTFKYRRKTSMSFSDFKKIIDDIAWFATDIQFSGGEPLINKDIFEMLRYAREKSIFTVLATNAQLLTRGNNIEKLLDDPPDSALISYESPEKEVYEKIRRRGSFDNLTDGIAALIVQKKKRRQQYPVIVLQMVLTKKTLPLVDSFWASVEALGADYGSIKALGVWPEGSSEYERLMAEEYIVPRSVHPISRHELDEAGNIVWFREPGQCPAVKHTYIGSGGEVIPCWYILADTWSPGNALDTNFVDLWNSKAYREYRHKMLNDWAHPLCRKCIGIGATSEQRKFF